MTDRPARRNRRRLLLAASLLALSAGCAAPVPKGSYRVLGRTYTPVTSAEGFRETGLASWYGADFHGKRTSNGEVYDMYGRTCAHKLLPLGTTVRVTNLDNGRSVEARVNDRGPFVDGRIVDLTYTLAQELDVARRGTAAVRLEAIAGPRGSPPPGPALVGSFACQVGAFTVPGRAQALAESLRVAFADVTVEAYDRGDARFHRVRVGDYRTPGDAQGGLSALRARGFTPFVVRRD